MATAAHATNPLRDFMVTHPECDMCGAAAFVLYGTSGLGRYMARCRAHSSPIRTLLAIGTDQIGEAPPLPFSMIRARPGYGAEGWELNRVAAHLQTCEEDDAKVCRPVLAAAARSIEEGNCCAGCEVPLTFDNAHAVVRLTKGPAKAFMGWVLLCAECHNTIDDRMVELMADRLQRPQK